MSNDLKHAHFVISERGHFSCRYTDHGEPLVMIHGWPESSYCWLPVASRLDTRFRCILPDLRGLGDSERTTGVDCYQKAELARDILSMLDVMEIETFFLVGHDWGGAVAQELALLAPERVRRLVIINISIINNRKGQMEAQTLLNSRGNRINWYQHFQQAKGMPEALIPGNEEAWLRFFLAGVPEDAVREYVRCYQIPGTPAAAAGLYRAFPSDIAHWAHLADVVSPIRTLYIHGTRDRVVIPQFLNHAEACFENLQIERLDAGHFVPEEQPDAVAGLIDAFLKNE
jgi:pimeloyl-ACP methyl ester carboxylesterase